MNQTTFLLLQINDALFPIGGYTQSYGLETYIQMELVQTQEQAQTYLIQQLKTSFLTSELLAVKLAYEATKQQDISALLELEQLAHAAKAPKELRLASARLGSRFYKAVQSMGIALEDTMWQTYYTTCQPVGLSHAIAYGVFCACANIGMQEGLSAYLYAQTSSNVTTCVKLIPLSQTAGQQLLYRCYPVFEELLEQVNSLGKPAFCRSAPALDIRSMQHEVLYSRLYMS